MKNGFCFTYVIDGKIKRITPLDEAEKKLILQGIDYAMQKDYLTKRKTRYRNLLRKLNVVVKGW